MLGATLPANPSPAAPDPVMVAVWPPCTDRDRLSPLICAEPYTTVTVVGVCVSPAAISYCPAVAIVTTPRGVRTE